MRKVNIFTKIIVLNLGLTVFLAGSITLGVNYFMSKGFEEQSLERLASNQRMVDGEIADSSKDMSAVAMLASSDRNIAQAMADRDTPALQAYAKGLIEKTRVEFVTISDAAGTVLARGHSDKVGDSVLKQINVQKALKGEATTGIEPGTVVKFSLRAGQPVTLDGTLVGVITTGVDIASHSFVDRIKDRLGVACTIFDKDTRASTTIIKDGKRAVGTKMDNPKVLDTVLTQGKTFKARNTILGIDYDTLYWPIIDAGGKIAGMYFIGVQRDIILATQSHILDSVLIITAIVSLLIVVASAFFARSLSRPIARATAFATQVADGDLDQVLDVKSNDEVGVLAGALKRMVESLKEMIVKSEAKTREAEDKAEQARLATAQADEAKCQAELAKHEGMIHAAQQIEAIVERVSQAAKQLAIQVDSSASGAERQKDRATETATSMEEMNATVLEVARNASQSASDAEDARTMAQNGNKSVAEVVKAIEEVKAQAQGLQTSMGTLGQQAEDIGRIMQVIEDIADQTNLLALNAAIEAARAGEAGRGFAVVADEVRKLAEKTMAATKEVGQAISAIQDGARKSVANTSQAVQSVAKSTSLAEESGQVLGKIVDIVSNTAGQIASIATAAEQQSATSEEINRAVDDISAISNETAQTMAQAAEAVEDLTQQAQELQSLVRKMKES